MHTNSLSRRIARMGLVSVSPLALAAGLLAAGASPAAASCTLSSAVSWTDGNGNWGTGTNWSGGSFPNSSATNACITDGSSSVTLNVTASVASLQIGSGNGLSMNGGTTLNIAGPSWLNAGSFAINGGGGTNTIVQLGGNVNLSGGGTVTMNVAGGGGNTFLRGSGVTLTNADNTIQGAGFIGDSGALTVDNAGTINANASGQTLDVSSAGGSSVTNTGTLEATNGGTLALHNTTTSTGGAISASGSGSTVNVIGTITGGTLNTGSGGVIQSDGGGTVLDGVAISTGSTYTAALGTTTALQDTIINKGTLAVKGGGGTNTIVNVGNVTLTGGGAVTMSVASGGGNAFLRGNSVTLTNTNNTIQGAGAIGDSGALTVDNEATINANASGQTLDVSAAGGSSVSNTGTLEATNGGTLTLHNTTTNTGSGAITASGSGSTVNVVGTISGGTLNTSGSGVMQSSGGGTVLDGVTISSGSTYTVAGNNTTELKDTITNKGTLAINGGNGANTIVNLGNAVTLTGGGAVTMSVASGGGNAFLRGNGVTLTNTNNTIQGAGAIGDSGALTVDNEATINANASGQTLDVSAAGGSSVSNTGTLEATNGGTLTLHNTTTNTGSGAITASGSGSTVNVVGTISGGTLNTSGSGVMQSSGGGTVLDGVTISSGSTYTVAGNNTTELKDTITNKGTLAINGGNGANTIVNLGNAVTLTGGGAVTMSVASGGGNAFLRGNGVTLTNTNNTIQGAGAIGDSGALTINNEATINANASGQTLDVSAAGGSGVNNTGLLEATNGGTLTLHNTTTNTGSGAITASGSGSTVNVVGTISGGTLNTSGSGVMQSSGGGTVLDGVTISSGSTYTVAGNNTTALQGTITNQGNLQINGGAGANTIVNLSGDVTLSGGGKVSMAVASGGGNAFLRGNGVTLTNTNNTIQGAGNISDSGAVTLVNGTLGTIDSNAGGTLSIGAAGGSVLTNNGTLRVDPGSTLSVAGSATLTNFSGNTLTGGTYIVNGATGNTATMQLAPLGTSGGEIVNNAANIVLNGPNANTLLVDGAGKNALSALSANSTASSSLTIEGGYAFSAPGAFSNAGTINLNSGGSFGAAGPFTNSNLVKGNGTVTSAISNTGTVEANGGTLFTKAITGTTGTMQSDAGATLDISGASGDSTAGTLANKGNLNLGSNNITVTSDYTNASFGSGNAFNNHNAVSGTGKILAASATMDLSGPELSGNTLDVGKVRTNGSTGSSSTTLTITNNGTSTNLIGAVKNTGAPSILLNGGSTGADWTAAHGGGTANITVAFTGVSAGQLSGTLDVVNNFDNVASQTLNVAGTVYQIAQAGAQPTNLNLTASRVGFAASTADLTIQNVAPNTSGFTEALSSTASTGGGFNVNGGPTFTTPNLGPSASSTVAVALGTGTAGAFSGTVNIANTSIPVAGSGFSDLALAGQTVNVSGNVYATSVAQAKTSVDFGVVHVGQSVTSQSVTVTNAATGALTDVITGGFGTPAPGAPFSTSGNLGAGVAGNGGTSNALKVALDTSTAGSFSGSAALALASHDSELQNVSLNAGPVSLSAQVNNFAVAGFGKTSGDGSLSNTATDYVLNFGTVSKGASALTSELVAENLAPSLFSDFLSGDFSIASGNGDFGLTGFGASFGPLGGGDQTGPLGVTLSTSASGRFTEVIDLIGTGSFSGATYSPYAVDAVLTIEGTVSGTTAIPEPSTWAMIGLGFVGLGFVGYRNRKAAAAA